MIHLTVTLGDEVLDSYLFEESQKTITIGRNSSSDIPIKDNSVSRNHAKIEIHDNGHLLTDLQSQNGVFVNKKFVTSHWLQNGDKITIGRHTIRYLHENEDLLRTIDSTVVLDMTTYKNMRADSFLNAVLGEDENPIRAELFFLDQNRPNLELTKKTTTIGKSPDSDIVVSGMLLGKTTATISKRVGGHYLEFVGGLSKPKVNGESVTSAILLKHSAVIQVGKLRIKYVIRK